MYEIQPTFFFPISKQMDSSWTAILTVFSPETYLIILSIISIIIIGLTFNTWNSLNMSNIIVAVTKAILGQKFEDFSGAKFQKSMNLTSFILSLFGIFMLWYFAGVLTATLTVSEKLLLLQNLDDLKSVPENFKLLAADGYISNALMFWAQKSTENQKALDKFVTFVDYKDFKITEDSNLGYLIEKSIFMAKISDTESRKPCDFTYNTLLDFPSLNTGYMYPNNSMLQPLFDKFWLQIDKEGVFDRIKMTYQNAFPQCVLDPFQPVNFNFVLLIFWILWIGIFVSLVIFIIEVAKLM